MRPEAVLAKHARSFALAARILPAAQHAPVARLYAFCRLADDLADASPAGCNDAALEAMQSDVACHKSRSPATRDLLALVDEFALPRDTLLDLLHALRTDQFPRALSTVAELVRYAYGVASTVGVLMCHVLGVTDRRALPFAIDLGIDERNELRMEYPLLFFPILPKVCTLPFSSESLDRQVTPVANNALFADFDEFPVPPKELCCRM